MRAQVEVVFDDPEEIRTLAMAGRWVGGDDTSGDDSVSRGGALARNMGHFGAPTYSHQQLRDILDWIVVSMGHFDGKITLGRSMIEAEPESDVPLVANPAIMGTVLVESAEEAQRDLVAASYLITEALKIATPKVEYA